MLCIHLNWSCIINELQNWWNIKMLKVSFIHAISICIWDNAIISARPNLHKSNFPQICRLVYYDSWQIIDLCVNFLGLPGLGYIVITTICQFPLQHYCKHNRIQLYKCTMNPMTKYIKAAVWVDLDIFYNLWYSILISYKIVV